MNGGQFYPATVTPESRKRAVRDTLLAARAAGVEMTRAQAEALADSRDELWRNNVYTVAVERIPGHVGESVVEMTHLSIKRNDREPMHDWRELQQIKNEFVGPEREAVEVYPAESRKVDSANQYHLWVMPEGCVLPFGFSERFVVGPVEGTLSKQRAFSDDT